MKKILFTGGGSAGHVVPNIAIIEQLLSEGKHIKLYLEYNGTNIEAIGFSMGDYNSLITEGCLIDVAGSLEINSFRGIDNPQMIIKDIKRIKQA